MSSLIKAFLIKIFNWRDPKAWGSLFMFMGALLVQYVPFGQQIVDFVKNNPEEFIQAFGAIAAAMGLWNQQRKKAALDKLTEGEPTIEGDE